MRGQPLALRVNPPRHFPSFSEGLSLRALRRSRRLGNDRQFPFLFGGTFIEGRYATARYGFGGQLGFPFLFGGAFIEGKAA